MNGLILSLAAGILPMFLFAWFLYYLDRYEKEPLTLLTGLFLWGALIAAGAAFLINSISAMGIAFFTQSDLATQLVTSTLVAPVVEETLKGMAVLIVFTLFRPEFDSLLDGIVFAGIAALGFAAAENAWYIHQFGYLVNGVEGALDVALVRVFLVGWQHPFYSSFIGLGFALARQTKDSAKSFLYPLLGWSAAVASHLLHNLFAILVATLDRGGIFNIIWDWIGYIGLLILILLLIKREQNWMKEYLAPEIDRGVISPDRFQTACSAWRQSLAFLKGIGKGRGRLIRRYYQACGDLMHKLRQVSIQNEEEDEIHQEIDRLRGKLLDLAERI